MDGPFEDIKDVVDLRLDKVSERPSTEQLDENGTARQMGDPVHSHEHHKHPLHDSDGREKLSEGDVEEEPLYVSGAPSIYELLH